MFKKFLDGGKSKIINRVYTGMVGNWYILQQGS